ncbi:MAG: ABC transporter ATP-binding protein [Dehalococcoidales bacterium]|jgi:NitT/TauT family transport system ATP-binding protein|nr:ABC transporter ATP-binding protein [Dehalococcoidales bacterium]MDD3264868.1 ABC transporter ATP-binding protein [Dehalococcoidales bacterium]MDD4322360.1 ABC transporter ATP-binding protein [Dehalococcoidales bacterium]MDD4794622.1 ABC transporter ATP-binding protein [Dehalococcoidales bacterium]MDD5122155.1 ABC transporter ATP-binding protein [Dehalococcoidales bacterium]
MEASGNIILEVKNLSHIFGTLKVLDDISFDVKSGEVVCVLGPSGCGKTTLLRIIAGLMPVRYGAIRIGGGTTSNLQDIGVVFQEPRLLPWRTTTGNVVLPFELADGKASGFQSEIAEEALNIVGLSDFKESYPYQLSGGMRQRVSLARALVTNPRILLMDEPLTGLDVTTREELQEEIIRIWREKKMSLLWVTHDPEEAVFMADRVIVLSNRPTTIKTVLDIPISRPRSRVTKDFVAAEQELRRLLL